MRRVLFGIVVAAALSLSSSMARAQASLPDPFAIYGPQLAQIDEPLEAIEPAYPRFTQRSGIIRDGERVRLSFGGMELERTRYVYHPFDSSKVRHERVYLGTDRGDGFPRVSAWRGRERQDFPGGVKAESYGLALSWRF